MHEMMEIEELRIHEKISKLDLAKAANITPPTYYAYIKGKSTPSITQYNAMMKALGYNPHYIKPADIKSFIAKLGYNVKNS